MDNAISLFRAGSDSDLISRTRWPSDLQPSLVILHLKPSGPRLAETKHKTGSRFHETLNGNI